MFTGIVTATTKVKESRMRGRTQHTTFTTPRGWKFKKGESISVDGICSTVVATSKASFQVDYMRTTLDKTTASEFEKGRVVNLERPLAYRGRVDGYFVLGHVDGTGVITKVAGNQVTFSVPKEIGRYIAPRGSITVDGVALTIAEARGPLATVALIPYTRRHTNLGRLKIGHHVNLEADLLARYATKTLRKRNKS